MLGGRLQLLPRCRGVTSLLARSRDSSRVIEGVYSVAWQLVHGWIDSAFLGSLRLCSARHGENTASSTIA
jgi:hypothetical protein